MDENTGELLTEQTEPSHLACIPEHLCMVVVKGDTMKEASAKAELWQRVMSEIDPLELLREWKRMKSKRSAKLYG